MNLSEWLGKEHLATVLRSEQPQIVLFAANWCGYCSRFIQLVRNVDSEYNERINLVDADEPDESLWDIYSINLVPTLVVIDHGKEIMRREGRIGVGLRQDDLLAAIQAATTPR